jgi:PAS domain S-box-containing protein
LNNVAHARAVAQVTPEEMLGKRSSDFFRKELYTQFQEDEVFIMNTGQSLVDRQEHFIRRDGVPQWHSTTKVPLRNAQGEIVGLIGITRDISARKLAEQAARASEARFQLVIESAPDYIHLTDLQGNILLSNAAAIRDSGYAADELIGRNLAEFLTERSHATLVSKFPDLLHGERVRQEIEFVRRDGSVAIMDCSGAAVMDEEGQPETLVIVQRDVTEQRRAQDMLERALHKERELGELKSRFVSMASHEFRTPLSTILAMTETLSVYRTRLTEEQIDQRLGKIREQIAYLKDIMEDFLQLARIQSGRIDFHPAPLDLDVLCREMIDEFESRPSMTRTICYKYPSAPRLVALDKKLMRQIISNLLSNAIKYSFPHTPIYVSLDYEQENGQENACLSVQDSGIGIPPDDLKHLFEPFHRATNVDTIPGTGIGLTITKQSVDLHQGHITINSEIGRGTTITICIPARTEYR